MSNKNMFNKKEMKKRIGSLKKSVKLDNLKPVENYFFEIMEKYKIDVAYDVIADEIPYFQTLAYTEWAGSFIVYPLCNKLREEQIKEAYEDNNKIEVNLTKHLKKRLEDGYANKYQKRKTPVEIPRKNLVVLLGSNKLKDCICLNKLKWVNDNFGDNIWFKPHPLTKFGLIGELKDLFGEENILHRDTDIYYFLQHADTIFSTHHSETVVNAIALNKKVEPIDVFNMRRRGAFSHINKYLFETKDPTEFINIMFNSPKCGIFNPEVDINWQEKMDNYINYIINKRDKFLNKYIIIDKHKEKNSGDK